MKQTIRVGDIQAAAGEFVTGFIRVGELSDGCTPLQVPVMVLNGKNDGPIVYLHSGSHGQEPYYAIEAFRRLTRQRLAPDDVRGALIIVPVANLLAYQACTRIAPQYGVREQRPFSGDLHRGWPGRPDGFLTERLANGIWTEIVSRADYVIDYHSVGVPGISFAYLYRGGTEDRRGTPVWEQAMGMAEAVGLTRIVTAPADTLAGACLDAGKPAIMMELASARMVRESEVDLAVQGTINILSHLGIVEEEKRPVDTLVIPGIHNSLPALRAARGGIIHYAVEPGVFLRAGTVIARVYDVFGSQLEAITMAQDAYVSTFPPMSWVGAQAVASGDFVADLFAAAEDFS